MSAWWLAIGLAVLTLAVRGWEWGRPWRPATHTPLAWSDRWRSELLGLATALATIYALHVHGVL